MKEQSTTDTEALATDDGEETRLLGKKAEGDIRCTPRSDRRINKGLKVAAGLGILGLAGGVGGAIAYSASHQRSSNNGNSTFTNTTFNDTAPLPQFARSGNFFPPVRERLGTASCDTMQRSAARSMLGLAAVPFGGLILMLVFMYVVYAKYCGKSEKTDTSNSDDVANKNFDV